MSDRRLGIFNDSIIKGSFVVATTKCVFAHIDRIGKVWIVWLYDRHIARKFCELRTALEFVNSKFMESSR